MTITYIFTGAYLCMYIWRPEVDLRYSLSLHLTFCDWTLIKPIPHHLGIGLGVLPEICLWLP